MTRTVRAFLSATSLLASAAAFPALAACSFAKVAELPVTMSGLRPLVPAKINGKEVHFLADSGAFYSTMTRRAAAQTAVRGRGSAKGVGGVSGAINMDIGVAESFELAGLTFNSVTFLLGADVMGDDVAGLLGQNVLGSLDVEYDLANGVIRIFRVQDCDGAFLAYWAADQRAGMLPMAPRSRLKPHIIVPASVNGQPIRALLDTGASTSMLKVTAAARAGVKISSEGVIGTAATYGISGRPMDTWLAPVSSFAFGDEEIRNTRLRISKVELEDAEMLIGADFFLSHRIFVSNSQSRLYFTYNGGPVFRLDGPAPTAPIAAAGAPETLADADAYDRRAAAFVSRRDYASAIADYAKAIGLEPKAAKHRYARALVYVAAGKPDLALTDLDEVLKLTPEDVDARMTRARLHLTAKDQPRAQADLDATLKDLPADSMQLVAVAALYQEAGYYREALPYYDRWIAGHPDDKRMPQVLNGRCWTRAIWGQELDRALADCEESLRVGGRRASALDSRGLVRLRMGQVDAAIADYDAALRMDPNSAWSLYARGLARHRNGLKAKGDEDIAAALKLEFDLADQAKRYGLEAP